MAESKREYHNRRLKSMKTERSTFDSVYRSISSHLLPVSGRFLTTERNKKRDFNEIIDETASHALGVLAAGEMAGETSPAKNWFRLGSPDKDRAKFGPIRQWMDAARDVLMAIFNGSNTYRVLHGMYEERGAFGTASAVVTRDFKDVIRLHPQTVGEYYIANNNRGEVDTLYREFDMQVAALVQEYGLENVSQRVKDRYNNGRYDDWVTVIHAIEPRRERDHKKHDNKNMPFMSVHYEAKTNEKDKFLRESGYRNFPGLVPRWVTRGQDIYGHGPGMQALGSIQQLQFDQLKKSNAIDYKTDPPLQIPSSLKDSSDVLPGGKTFYDQNHPAGGIRTAFEVNVDLNPILLDIQDIRDRIRTTFFTDLFQMIALSDRRQVTAREIEEKHSEKLLILGPVLERGQNEIGGPLIDIAFELAMENDLFPPIPQEMSGMDLTVEFVGMLAQAQKSVGINGIERLLGSVGSISQLFPRATGKVNFDVLVDELADMYGVPSHVIVANEQVALIRKKEDQQQAMMQQMQGMMETADAAKTLSETDTGGANALTDIKQMLTGN